MVPVNGCPRVPLTVPVIVEAVKIPVLRGAKLGPVPVSEKSVVKEPG